MWVLNYLPDWIFHLVIILGVAALITAYSIRHIPFTRKYALPLNIGGVIALVVGIWFEGATFNEAEWQERIRELEGKLAIAEQQSHEANQKLAAAIASKEEAIKTRNATLLQYIDVEVAKYNETCKIPVEFIDVLNKAAEPIQ